MTSNRNKWLLVVSPDGAARTVARNLVDAFQRREGSERVKEFDTLKYRSFFLRELSCPGEETAIDLINHALIVGCLDFQATHMLVCALSPVTAFSCALVRRYGVGTAHWFYEDFRRAPYWRQVVGAYDWFFAIQREPIIDECARLGVRYGYLPTAASFGNMEIASSRPPVRDVAFVGVPSVYRVELLEFLVSNGITAAIAGEGWDRYAGILEPHIICGSWTGGREAAAILGQARIGIHISFDDPGLQRHYAHVSPRLFDIMRSGAVLLTEETPLTMLTCRGCRYHGYHDKTEALDLVRRILAAYPEERRLAEANRRIVSAEHTYDRRAETIIERLTEG